MTTTPFSSSLKDYSDRIHREWRNVIYPRLYNVDEEDIQYWDEAPEHVTKLLDRQFAIDCILRVFYNGARDSFLKTVQYRFREAQHYQHHQDLTITVWNDVSNQRSELFKMAALLFTYGYYDSPSQRLAEVIVVDAPNMINAIAERRLQSSNPIDPRNNRSQQPFQGYKFEDLKRLGLVYMHLKEADGVLVLQSREVNA